MVLRIIYNDKKDDDYQSTFKRNEIASKEAERFGALKGGDLEKSKAEFLAKLNRIREIINTKNSKTLIENLKDKIEKNEKEDFIPQKKFNPSTILDLL